MSDQGFRDTIQGKTLGIYCKNNITYRKEYDSYYCQDVRGMLRVDYLQNSRRLMEHYYEDKAMIFR